MLARLAELPLLVVLVAVTGCLCLVPAMHGVATDQHALSRAFFYSGLILMILAVMLGIATAAFSPKDVARSQLASLAGAFVFLPVAMALPMLEAVPDTTAMNAWFEMVSSFSTTGATVFAPDRLSDTIHLWRACVGWFGGFLSLMAAYGILAPMNLGGVEVATGRVPGRGSGRVLRVVGSLEPAERLTRTAFRILPIYAALTALLWFGLILAGETATTALIHAMGTLSTSGISGQVAPGLGTGVPGEALILTFLLFAVSHRSFQNLGLARSNPLRSDPELRLAGVIVATVTAIVILRHGFAAEASGTDTEPVQALQALWGALFTSASFLSTTGYVSQGWHAASQWSGIPTPGLIFLGLAVVGGGTATAAGGVKLLRVYVLLRHGERELERIIHPNSVGGGGNQARRLRREGALMAWVFFVLFATAIAVVLGVLLILGVAFEQALVLTIAALTLTGPLADIAAAAPIPYADLPGTVKLALGMAMVVGRLETLALIAILRPLWRRLD